MDAVVHKLWGYSTIFMIVFKTCSSEGNSWPFWKMYRRTHSWDAHRFRAELTTINFQMNTVLNCPPKSHFSSHGLLQVSDFIWKTFSSGRWLTEKSITHQTAENKWKMKAEPKMRHCISTSPQRWGVCINIEGPCFKWLASKDQRKTVSSGYSRNPVLMNL